MKAGELFQHTLGGSVDAIVVDFHAEATSEKQAMGHFCDGRASLVVGTHTHVPTCDHRILPKGTAYCTDIGMTGPYDSVIGVEKEIVIKRFVDALPAKFETAKGERPKVRNLIIQARAAMGSGLGMFTNMRGMIRAIAPHLAEADALCIQFTFGLHDFHDVAALLRLADKGIKELIHIQKTALKKKSLLFMAYG